LMLDSLLQEILNTYISINIEIVNTTIFPSLP